MIDNLIGLIDDLFTLQNLVSFLLLDVDAIDNTRKTVKNPQLQKSLIKLQKTSVTGWLRTIRQINHKIINNPLYLSVRFHNNEKHKIAFFIDGMKRIEKELQQIIGTTHQTKQIQKQIQKIINDYEKL